MDHINQVRIFEMGGSLPETIFFFAGPEVQALPRLDAEIRAEMVSV